jgi:predicted phage terminase large subunit-like protein
MIVATAGQDQGRWGYHEIDLPQDPGGAGKIQARSLVGALAGYIAHASPESGDKESRAMPVAAQAKAGNFSMLEGPWNEDMIAELEKFPTGAYKDRVDALSRAFGRFVLNPGAAVVVPVIVTTPYSHFGDHNG